MNDVAEVCQLGRLSNTEAHGSSALSAQAAAQSNLPVCSKICQAGRLTSSEAEESTSMTATMFGVESRIGTHVRNADSDKHNSLAMQAWQETLKPGSAQAGLLSKRSACSAKG